MKLGIMQPYFVPYIGYWQRMAYVDVHVIYDDVNYIKGGWINRNRILVNGEPRYFNVPLHGASPNKLINEVEISLDDHEAAKMKKTLRQAYAKAPNLNPVMDLMGEVLSYRGGNLAEFLERQLSLVAGYLGIKTKTLVSSRLHKDNSLKGQEKVIAICHELDADVYVNALSGNHLYSKDAFEAENMTLEFIEDKGSTSYPQSADAFVPSLSIIDVMMNCSRGQIEELLADYQIS